MVGRKKMTLDDMKTSILNYILWPKVKRKVKERKKKAGKAARQDDSDSDSEPEQDEVVEEPFEEGSPRAIMLKNFAPLNLQEIKDFFNENWCTIQQVKRTEANTANKSELKTPQPAFTGKEEDCLVCQCGAQKWWQWELGSQRNRTIKNHFGSGNSTLLLLYHSLHLIMILVQQIWMMRRPKEGTRRSLDPPMMTCR